jgi:hypothetical protein
VNTKEIALVSIFSAVWVVSQIYLGPVIGQLTTLHGLVQRFMGWFLMLVLAELIGRFGRVTSMATISAFATRMVRYSASFYVLTVGLGYALGGLIFDVLFFLPILRRVRGAGRITFIAAVALASGSVASVPYIVYRLTILGLPAFIVWLPLYLSTESIDIGLSVLGTLGDVLVVPRVKTILPILHPAAKA